jgi:sterol desaturase/sphingolipid hydroxylase (fatty acid hydroxylase superfamily)
MEAETLLRIAAFGGALIGFGLWESLAPDRARVLPRLARWRTNAVLFLIGAGLARLAAPAGVVGAAVWAHSVGIGLFNQIDAPAWLAFAVSLLALDLAMYAQHRALHAVPLLWRLHAPHHGDPDLDVTTGLRFHPGEFLFSLAWKAGAAIALGAPPAAVLAFEILLNGFSIFTHANGRLGVRAEQIVGAVFITPRAHRLHHERAAGRHSGNYGFSLTVWDRLFGTYAQRPAPAALGLETVAPQDAASAVQSLALFQSASNHVV